MSSMSGCFSAIKARRGGTVSDEGEGRGLFGCWPYTSAETKALKSLANRAAGGGGGGPWGAIEPSDLQAVPSGRYAGPVSVSYNEI